MNISPYVISIIETIVRFLAYLLLIVGVFLIIFPWIRGLFVNKGRNTYKFKSKHNQNKSKFIIHIDALIGATINKNSYLLTSLFLFLSFSLFVLSFILFYNANFSSSQVIIFSIFSLFLPYILLRIRLNTIRVEGSYEAEAVVSEISTQYKINHLNMMEGLNKAIPRLKKQPYTQKALFRLITNLNTFKTEEDIKKNIADFNYSINTQWAINLGNNIYLSIYYGDDVRESLDDIMEQIKDLNNINEQNKRLNSESFLMIKYMAPLMYIATLILLFRNFKFTLEKYIDYQFINPLGLKMFIFTIGGIIINYIVYILIKKPKNDL